MWTATNTCLASAPLFMARRIWSSVWLRSRRDRNYSGSVRLGRRRAARSGRPIAEVAPNLPEPPDICDGADFMSIAEKAKLLKPDLLIGNSKGYGSRAQLGIPLVRVGFPIHDRIGGQRILHLGYRGAQQLFDRIVNALIECKQQTSQVGYSYM